jgi:tetratricopeptide (TPR) repeat protein
LAALQPLLGADDPLPYRWLNERLLSADGGEPAALADSLAAEAEAPSTAPARAAALWHRRGILLANRDDAAALEAQRQALALDGNHGAAAVEALAVLHRTGQLPESPSIWRPRLQAAGDRPEAVALGLRSVSALADDLREPAEAQKLAADAQRRAPEDPAVRDAVVRAARLAGDPVALVEALEQELVRTTDPAARFALLCVLGEKLESHKPDRAAERFRQALELRPRHPIAQAALERSLESAHNHAALADLALADLKEATDATTKVRAYERLAYIDRELRGDAESALLGCESILEVDHANHRAMRVLEAKYLKESSWGDLVPLYEQMGLTATDPAFAAAVHLDRARLRALARPGASTDGDAPDLELRAAIDNDYRLTLFKDPRSRPALRHALARARQANDLGQIADVSTALAEAVGDDGRTAAVCLTRAAEALIDLDRGEEAALRFHAAVERGGLHLPALAGLADLELVRGEYSGAVSAAEEMGQALKSEEARASAYLLAGALADEKLGDLDRSVGDLRQALAIEPRSLEAFERLKQVLERRGDWVALSLLFARRLEVETDGLRLTEMHLELARIARDHLGDKERARSELRAVLEQDAAHSKALAMLADLYYDDQQWNEAAETLIKRARIEKTRDGLKDIFFKLGVIYDEKQPDAKRAIASFSRVIKADPTHLVALEHLSNLLVKEWEWKGALEATVRLAEMEKDRTKKITHYLRVAKIYEEGFKDARRALEAHRAALDIDPMNLTSIGEMSKFFDRQSDVQSMRVHLDRAAARMRSVIERDTWDPTAYHGLFKIFGWRRAPDRAAMAAGVLDHLGQANEEEKAVLQKAMAREPYPGSALADAALDDWLFDTRVPAGFRHLFRMLDDSLSKMFRADIKRLGLGKNEKLPSKGHAVRDLANRIAADLGVRDFDLYVTAQHPSALMVELTDPLSIIVGSKLVEGAHEQEMRFHLGRALKMMQSKLALPMRLLPEDLGVLVGAIVRQFVPDFVPQGFDEKQIAPEAARLSKLIPKKMQGELFPFAMECASPSLDLKQIAPALVDAANRAGLLTCGLMAPSLKALRRLEDEAQVRALIRFALSEEIAELRRQAGTSLG